MRNSALAFAVALAFSGIASAANASAFLVQFDDLTDNLVANTYQDGTLIQNAVIGGESYTGTYGLWTSGDHVLAADVNVQVNILEADGTLSDTWSITGNQGDTFLQVPFFSDIEGQTLTPLVTDFSLLETGDWQTVATFNAVPVTGGPADTYVFQFRSDITEGVPEPVTFSLFGAGLAGLGAMRRRRKAKV